MVLLLFLFICVRGYILENDGALDFLAGKDSLFVPMDKHANVAGLLGWGHLERNWSLSEGRELGWDAGQTDAASPTVLSRSGRAGKVVSIALVVKMGERRGRRGWGRRH